MVKSIYLQDGEEIFVDDEDYERVNQHTWYKHYGIKSNKNNVRIKTTVKGKPLYLYNFIKEGSFQKIRGNDFTRKNLTTKGNAQRWAKARSTNSSKYKGVCWAKKQNKWRAALLVDGKNKHLGYYVNEDDAARAYNQAVLDYWKGEGYLNIIGIDNRTPMREYITSRYMQRRKVGKSGYKGVSKANSKNSPYNSTISFINKSVHIANFKTAEQAALAYNKVVIYLHGDEAILNEVPITEELKEFIANWEIPEKVIELKEEEV